MTVKTNEPYVLIKATHKPIVTNPNPSLGPVGVDPTPSLRTRPSATTVQRAWNRARKEKNQMFTENEIRFLMQHTYRNSGS